MSLPVNASVEAARSFVRDLRAAQDFMRQQDELHADERFTQLRTRLDEARKRLSWNPQVGRPARLMDARTVQALYLVARAKGLGTARNLPWLRELVIKPYILLYAHGEKQVFLLALKHERQQAFGSFAS